MAKNNLRKISGIASALLVAISLTGCVSYEEIYGRVVDKSQNSDTTMMMAGKVMIPMNNTNYDLTVEHKKEGSLTKKRLTIDHGAFDRCEVGDYIFRASDTSIICKKESFR